MVAVKIFVLDFLLSVLQAMLHFVHRGAKPGEERQSETNSETEKGNRWKTFQIHLEMECLYAFKNAIWMSDHIANPDRLCG